MFTTHLTSAVPASLEKLLLNADTTASFSLRAVLAKDVVLSQWVVMGAVIRPAANVDLEYRVCRYQHALLLAMPLSGTQVLSLLQSISQGTLTLEGESLTFVPPRACNLIQVSVENYWMSQAGIVYDIQLHQQVNVSHQERLVAPNEPYYPDVHEAARDWLGLREHHGSSDGNSGHLMVLVPETRAYFEEFRWADDRLEVSVGGSLAGSGSLLVSGACWVGRRIHHLSKVVSAGEATLTIPSDARRLDLLIVDSTGALYDFHTEETAYATGSRAALANRRSASVNASVLREIYNGEGVRTEFKEFLDIPKSKAPLGEKDKLQQVLRTVAAFANTEGGTLYFGVSDSCEIVGTAMHVAKWVDGTPDAAAVDSYMGALRAKVHDAAYPSVRVQTRAIYYDDLLVIALEVSRATETVSLRNDPRIYERRGSSNIAVAPADWKAREHSWHG